MPHTLLQKGAKVTKPMKKNTHMYVHTYYFTPPPAPKVCESTQTNSVLFGMSSIIRTR